MEREFKKEGAKLMGRKIDVAFLVLDPRQESYFWWGFDWWMRTMQVQLAFPMHSWESFSLTQKLKALPCSEPYRDRVMEIFLQWAVVSSGGMNGECLPFSCV